ncbi:MAG: HU family DNA-binding protein [Prevotellaceae bacterium]|jgi:predicted histone-like DNA-binding protein|nr:HU family DNA-binding protein [Prevotellaceae bacterium]
MPLFYNKIERGNPADTSAPKLWYPVLKSTGLVKEKEVARQLADETTLNAKEAEMAVSQLLKVVTKLLLDGHTVQLGSLGSFRLTANASGVATEAEVTAAQIKKLNVRFSESEELKDAVKKATFKDVASLSNK